MSSAPVCAGLHNPTFSPEQGEGVFLCPNAGDQALSSQPSALSFLF